MYQRFEKVKEEKKQRIIYAAFEEFAQQGYDKASTNVIVSRAGISKGALYHYFGSKEGLFVYLCELEEKIMEEEYYKRIPRAERDLLVRCAYAFQLKLDLHQKYPTLIEFLKALIVENSEQVGGVVKEKISRWAEQGHECLMAGIDETMFVPAGTVSQMQNIILWTMEGYAGQLLAGVDWKEMNAEWMESMKEEFYSYLKLLRTCLYQDNRK